MVLVQKEERRKIYEYLIREGVLVIKKDPYLPKHQHIDVRNLHVMMVANTLKSKGIVEEVYNWNWHYYHVTSAGVKFLINALGLPSDIVPNTFKQSKRAAPKTEAGEDEKPGRFADAEGEDKPATLGRGRK